MKLHLCAWFFLFCVSAQSQISYTYNDGPKAGIKIKKGNLLATSAMVAELSRDGADENWDIRNAEKDTSFIDREFEYKLPKDVPNSNQFPAANLASVPTHSNDETEFYNQSINGLTFLGVDNGGAEYIKFKKGLLVAPYPLNVGMSFPDHDSALVKLGSSFLETDINTNSIVVGWGEIKTPTESFLCLKLKNIQIWEGFEGSNQRLSYTIENNLWLASNRAQPVAELVISELVLDTFTIQDTTITYLINQSVISKINDHQENTSFCKIIPVPTEEKIKIEMMNVDVEKVHLTVVDAQSKIIYQQKFTGGDPISFSTFNWPAGVYLVHLVLDDQEVIFDKFIKN